MSSPARNIHVRVSTNQYAGEIYMHHPYHGAVHRRSPAHPDGASSNGVRAVPKKGAEKMGWIIKRDGIPCLFRSLFFWAGHYYLKHGSDAGAAMCPALHGSVLLSGTDRHGPEISTRASSTERGFFFGDGARAQVIVQSALQFSAGLPLWIGSKRV
jgi:hypothetical protein